MVNEYNTTVGEKARKHAQLCNYLQSINLANMHCYSYFIKQTNSGVLCKCDKLDYACIYYVGMGLLFIYIRYHYVCVHNLLDNTLSAILI